MKITAYLSISAVVVAVLAGCVEEKASAQSTPQGPLPELVVETANAEKDNRGNFANLRKQIEQFNGPRAEDYTKANEEEKKKLQNCYSTYSKLYKTSKDTIDIRLAFGYVDNREYTKPSFVYDQVMRAATVEHLMEPCPKGSHPSYFACGFSRDPDDANILTKKVSGLDGRKKTIQITVTHGSSSFDDDYNCQRKSMTTQRCVPHEGQKYQTQLARKNFLGGLNGADVVLYAGHSRDGGGPDFTPPYLASLKAVDERRYRTEGRKNYQAMLSALREASPENRPELIGIFSCSSIRWFKNGVKSVAPESGFIGSTQSVYLNDELLGLVATLDSVIGMRCEDDFAKAIAVSSKGKAQFKIDSFFKPLKSQNSPEQSPKERARKGVL